MDTTPPLTGNSRTRLPSAACQTLAVSSAPLANHCPSLPIVTTWTGPLGDDAMNGAVGAPESSSHVLTRAIAPAAGDDAAAGVDVNACDTALVPDEVDPRIGGNGYVCLFVPNHPDVAVPETQHRNTFNRIQTDRPSVRFPRTLQGRNRPGSRVGTAVHCR